MPLKERKARPWRLKLTMGEDEDSEDVKAAVRYECKMSMAHVPRFIERFDLGEGRCKFIIEMLSERDKIRLSRRRYVRLGNDADSRNILFEDLKDSAEHEEFEFSGSGRRRNRRRAETFTRGHWVADNYLFSNLQKECLQGLEDADEALAESIKAASKRWIELEDTIRRKQKEHECQMQKLQQELEEKSQEVSDQRGALREERIAEKLRLEREEKKQHQLTKEIAEKKREIQENEKKKEELQKKIKAQKEAVPNKVDMLRSLITKMVQEQNVTAPKIFVG